MTAPASPRAFYYVQHLLGIGHIARASRVADALVRDGFEVTLVTGGLPVAGFPGPGVRHIALPPVRAGDASMTGLTDADGTPVDDAFKHHRRDLLLAAYHDCRPHVVITEAFPFGRRQMRFELIPLLDAVHATTPRPIVVSSVRDILQENRKPGRDEESLGQAIAYFDHILVHGDPTFARLEETFPLASRIADKIVYGGLVAPPQPTPSPDRFDIVVSAGGGAVGAAMLRATAGAVSLLPANLTWCLISGVNLAQGDYDGLAAAIPPNATLIRFRRDFTGLLSRATLSVSQAGYNTAGDVLVAGCRSLMVPFIGSGETEQALRAERLAALGLAHVLTEDALTPQQVAQAIKAALAAPPPPRHRLDLNGADQAAHLIRSLL